MEAILAIAVLAGLIWGLVLFARGGLMAGCLVLLLAGCCFGHPFFHLAGGPIPLTFDRLLWIALLGGYVVAWRQGWTASRRPAASDWTLGVLMLVLLASTLSHNWRQDGNAPLAHLVFCYVMPVGLYWVAREIKLTKPSLHLMLVAFAVFALYVAVTAVAEVNALWWAVFPRYIADPQYLEFFGRGRGPLLNPVASGYYQAVGMFATMQLWSPSLRRSGHVIILAALGIIGLGVFCTLTRSVWLGTGLGMMTIAFLRMPGRYRAPAFGAVLILGTTVIATQWERLVAFKRDQALSAREAAESMKLRPILARVAWDMFCDKPLFGCGYGQYMEAQVDYLSDRSTELPLSKARPYVQHNVFLSLLAETGLVGMSLFTALLAIWTRNAWRLWRDRNLSQIARAEGLFFLAMMAYYLANAMFQDISLMAQANMLLFFLGGINEATSAQFGANRVLTQEPVSTPE